ncbi:zinc-binding dehydrogenase [Gluconobacter sp. P1D12_c]|uniref:zinc-dependent alcohol dehydrogenase n=1 Tax=Gluconobacter sp. P1D12_c TaxID=2762614 RepID=UPI001C051DC3|nr:alcohol dehydrogenase catalytic domain-containing protein [Gluconobacter sp. P1D12_c]
MLAARFSGIGDIQVLPVPISQDLPDGCVRIRVEAAGICGSDLHNFRTGQWLSRCPITPGHEFSGIITQTSGDCGSLTVGTHVIADSRVGCGTCQRCQSGLRNLCRNLSFVGESCDGGFAQEVILPATQVLPFPDTLPLRYGALVEPLSVSLHAVNRLAPTPGSPVVICGGGTIGGLAALLLRQQGHDVHMLERSIGRQTLLAETIGTAPLPLDAEDWNILFGSEGPAFILDATGAATVVEMACQRLAPGGRLVLAGIFHHTPRIDLNVVVERELDIRGVSAFADEMPEAIQRLPGLIPFLDRLITPAAALTDLPVLYTHLLSGSEKRLKTLIAPNGTDGTW